MSFPIAHDGISCAINGQQVFAENRPAIESNGREYYPSRITQSTDDSEFTLSFDALGLEWRWRVTTTQAGRMLVRSSLHSGERSVELGRCVFVDTHNTMLRQPPDHKITVLTHPYDGAYPFRFVYDIRDPVANYRSTIKLQFFDQAATQALQIGFITFQHVLNTNDCYIARNRDGKRGELVLRLHYQLTGSMPVSQCIRFGLTP